MFSVASWNIREIVIDVMIFDCHRFMVDSPATQRSKMTGRRKSISTAGLFRNPPTSHELGINPRPDVGLGLHI